MRSGDGQAIVELARQVPIYGTCRMLALGRPLTRRHGSSTNDRDARRRAWPQLTGTIGSTMCDGRAAS